MRSEPRTPRLPRPLSCLESHESVRREALQTLLFHVITRRSRRLPDQRPRRLKSLSAECDLVKEGIKYWSEEKTVNKAGFRCVAGSPAVRVKHWQNCYGSRLRQTKKILPPAGSEHAHTFVFTVYNVETFCRHYDFHTAQTVYSIPFYSHKPFCIFK